MSLVCAAIAWKASIASCNVTCFIRFVNGLHYVDSLIAARQSVRNLNATKYIHIPFCIEYANKFCTHIHTQSKEWVQQVPERRKKHSWRGHPDYFHESQIKWLRDMYAAEKEILSPISFPIDHFTGNNKMSDR